MATVVITGANRGIGLAMTRHYASRGDNVIALARNPGASTELTQLAKSSTAIDIHAADVTDETSLAAAANAVGASAIDIIVCNAGIMSSRGGLTGQGYDAAEWQRVFMTNVAGPFFTARTFLPGLKKAKAGKIAIISSMMGSSTQASGSVYGYRASKAAAANLGANLAVELKPMGIAVGIYHPGWVSSDMGGASAPVTPAASAKGLVARIDTLSLATTGVFEDYQGKPYAF